MEFLESIWNKARKLSKKIILPETNDIRVLKAAELISKSNLANLILIGNPSTIKKTASENSLNLNDIEIMDPQTSPKINRYIEIYLENRKKKGKDIEFNDAKALLLSNSTYFGAMIVADAGADGMVSGAANPTANTIKASLYSVGLSPNISTLSSFFIMIHPNSQFGMNGILFFADCAVVPEPDEKQLCDIAISTSNSFRQLMMKEAKIAMLSFSTFASGKSASQMKVANAAKLIAGIDPNLLIDGEIQFDAAIIPSISKIKFPNSKTGGRANVFIFPNLDAGNIGYKIAERLGGAMALGPIFQGCAKPINDLSRGCSVDDIVNICAITAIQSEPY